MCAVAVFRKRGVISKLSETGVGEGRYSSRAVVDVDARYSEGGCGIERGIRRCNVRFPADDGKVSLKHRIGIERFGVAQGCRLSYERSGCSIRSGGEIRANRNSGIRGGRYGAGCHLIAVVVGIAEEQTVGGAQVMIQTHVELIGTLSESRIRDVIVRRSRGSGPGQQGEKANHGRIEKSRRNLIVCERSTFHSTLVNGGL